jgi:hypothetical protein
MAQPIFASVNKPPLTTNDNCCLSLPFPWLVLLTVLLLFLVLVLPSLLLVVLRIPASQSFLLPENGCDSLKHTSQLALPGSSSNLFPPLTKQEIHAVAQHNTEDLLQTRFGSLKI